MQYLLSKEQMISIDQFAMDTLQIPSAILMENAAINSANIIKSKLLSDDNNSHYIPNILVLCGAGNNGGDGLAIARHLSDIAEVYVLLVGDEGQMSKETKQNFTICQNLDIPILSFESFKQETFNFEFDCIVDALIGIGGSENLKGEVLEVLELVSDSNVLKIAIDVPTGVNSNTGKAHELCFIADYTITMFAPKLGMHIHDAIDCCGEIITVPLGFPEVEVADRVDTFLLEEHDLELLNFDNRKKVSSKFDYGRLVIIAGSEDMPGAAALSANAAISSGAGFVYLVTPNPHSSILPEVIVYKRDLSKEDYSIESIAELLDRADGIVIGPGLGNDTNTLRNVKQIIGDYKDKTRMLIDADALKAVIEFDKLSKNTILTPHTGEFSAITGADRFEIETDYINKAKDLAQTTDAVVLLKFYPTCITNGKQVYLNPCGNPGLATAGSGDVLSGIIGGLMVSQNIPTTEAAYLGSLLHALAGDYAKAKYSEMTMSASDIMLALKSIVNLL